MDHSADDHSPKQLSRNAARIEHEIEGRLAGGHSTSKTVHDEVHRLRTLDSSHGKLNQQAYHTDLAAIDSKLHAKGYLPHMHILSHGRHAGELANEKHPGHPHQHGNETGQPQAHNRAPLAKEHKDNSDQGSGRASQNAPHKVEAAAPHKANINPEATPPHKAHVRPEAAASVAPTGPQETRTPAPVARDARGTQPARLPAPTPNTDRPETPARVATTETLPPTESPPPATPRGRESRPEAEAVAPAAASNQGGANYDQLKSAIQRAKAGGAPVRVLQYGDSHIADGHEAQEIKADLAQIAPDRYATKAAVGTSADYPTRKENIKSWLDRPISAVKPDLVIVSYGSNDGDMPWGKEYYKKVYDNLVSDIKQRAPNATLLLVGPTDRYTPKNLSLDTVIQAQKEVAAKYGADYYDIRQAMGGAGTIDELRKLKPPLAEPDRWHLTAPGYQLVGDMITKHIEESLK